MLSSADYALSLSLSPPSNQSLKPALNPVTQELLNGSLRCRSNYGRDLRFASCENAWSKIPRDNEVHLYGLRSDIAAGAHLDVGLPIRYLSDDGRCAIDIRARDRAESELFNGDSAKNIEVSDAARMVLDQCVPKRGVGGSISGFSERNLTVLIMTKYEPKAVCDPAPEVIPFVPFCEKVVQTMPTRIRKATFGLSEDRREFDRYNVVPRTLPFRQFLTFSSPCGFFVSF